MKPTLNEGGARELTGRRGALASLPAGRAAGSCAFGQLLRRPPSGPAFWRANRAPAAPPGPPRRSDLNIAGPAGGGFQEATQAAGAAHATLHDLNWRPGHRATPPSRPRAAQDAGPGRHPAPQAGQRVRDACGGSHDRDQPCQRRRAREGCADGLPERPTPPPYTNSHLLTSPPARRRPRAHSSMDLPGPHPPRLKLEPRSPEGKQRAVDLRQPDSPRTPKGAAIPQAAYTVCPGAPRPKELPPAAHSAVPPVPWPGAGCW